MAQKGHRSMGDTDSIREDIKALKGDIKRLTNREEHGSTSSLVGNASMMEGLLAQRVYTNEDLSWETDGERVGTLREYDRLLKKKATALMTAGMGGELANMPVKLTGMGAPFTTTVRKTYRQLVDDDYVQQQADSGAYEKKVTEDASASANLRRDIEKSGSDLLKRLYLPMLGIIGGVFFLFLGIQNSKIQLSPGDIASFNWQLLTAGILFGIALSIAFVFIKNRISQRKVSKEIKNNRILIKKRSVSKKK